MKNISKKLILFFCVVLLTTQISWSQSAVITSYNCTGVGTANISISPTTGITSYAWRVTGTTAIIANTPTSIQPAGAYTITIIKSGVTSTLSVTVVAGIIPTIPSVTPATISTPVCGSSTVTLTSTAVTNYTWKRDGGAVSGATNSLVVAGNDVGSPGNYSYTVSNTNAVSGCVSTSNAVAINMSPTLAAPTVSAANSNTVICGSSTQSLSASGGGASYVWRRGATTLANTSSNLTVTGTEAPAGTYVYTAALANSAGCPLNFSTTGVSLTLSPGIATPTISLVAPVISPICGTDMQVLTTSNVAGSTYFWKRDGVAIAGSTNSITVTGNDVSTPGTYNYTVAAQNAVGCISSDATPAVLKVSPKPAAPTIIPASFTPNVVCGTDFKTLTATSGGAKYNWKSNGTLVTSSTTTNSINVSGADALSTSVSTYIYTVNLENSVGCASDYSTAGVTLQLFPSVPTKPTVSSNGSATFCEGFSVRLNSSYTVGFNVWSKTIGTTIIGDTTTTGTDGVTVRTVGANTYTVKAKDANGCTSLASNPFLVTINPKPTPPIIDKGTADAICELDSITLTSNNKGTGLYEWNTLKTTTSITVKTAGSYSLTYTDANTCKSLPSFPFVLTINPLPAKPTITNLNKSAFCYREFTTLKAASTTAGTTFEWDYQNRTGNQIDVSGSSKKTVDEIIEIRVRAVSAFANSTISPVCKSRELSDKATITVKPLPTTPNISTSGPIIFCPDSTVSLTSTDSPNGVYKWFNSKNSLEFSDKKTVLIDTTSKNFTVTPLGKITKFYVQTIGNNECKSDTSQNITVTVRNAPLKAVINPSPISATVCLGGKVTLKALFSNGNINRYSWRDEATKQEVSTEQEVSVIATGTYTVKVRDVFGCFADNSDPLKVTISPLPTKPSITIIKPKIFCDEDSTTIQSSLPTTTPNGRNLYRWIVDGNTVLESISRTFSWKKANSISVAVTDSNGCKALASSDTIRTTVNPLPDAPSITVRGAIPFCADKNVTLSAVGTTGVTYKWSTGAITTNIVTNLAGNVTVQSINGYGCFSKPSQPVQVRVYALPTTPKLTANGVTTFCDGSKVRIVSSSPFQAYWFRSTTDSIGKGEDLTSIFASKTGNYFAKVQDDNGCISLASTPIAVDARPNPTPTIVKKIGTFSLDAQGVGDENGYIWRYNGDVQKDLTTRIIKAKKDGDYQVQASITYTGVALTGGKLVCYSNTSSVIKYEQDLTFNGFSIFPNPTANGEINVEVLEDLIGATVMVYSLYGQIIAEYKVDKFNTLKKIQLPDFHGSTFIVKVLTDGFDRTRRVVTLKQ
jgi:Ig-like domain CHU_C associated